MGALRVLCLVMAAAVSGCGARGGGGGDFVFPTPPVTPADDTLVVPGQRIGPIALGMTAKEVMASLGEPTKSIAASGGMWAQWPGGLGATFSGAEQRVTMVQTPFDDTFQTEQGITRGTSEFSVRTQLGNPARVDDPGEPKGVMYDLVYPAGPNAETVYQIAPDEDSSKVVSSIIVRLVKGGRR